MDFAVVDENVKTPEGEKMEVMIAVVKRQELEPTLEVFRSLECKLSSVDVDILSAMTALEHFYPEDFAGHVGLLDIGSEISTVGIIRGRKPCFIRDISYGTYDMLKRLTSRSGLSVEDIDQLFERGEVPAPEIAAEIAGSLDGIIGELKVSFDYYRDQARHEKPIQKLFVSGGGALHPVVLKALTQGLGITAAGFEVLSKIKWADSVDAEALRRYESCLSVPIGLALRPE
jgi:type IV pilus assembly protein PilM